MDPIRPPSLARDSRELGESLTRMRSRRSLGEGGLPSDLRSRFQRTRELRLASHAKAVAP